MTLEREKKMLLELRQMASMDKTEIAELYKVPIDSADVYRMTKTTAVLDTIMDSLDEEIAYRDQQNKTQ